MTIGTGVNLRLDGTNRDQIFSDSAAALEGTPPVAHDAVTDFGPGGLPDGSERGVVPRGEHRDGRAGDQFGIRGVLEVLRLPAAVGNGVNAPACVSDRVTGSVVPLLQIP